MAQSTEVTERQFATRRIGAGRYLQVSDDKRRAWMVERYEEDGSLSTWDGKIVTGAHWRCIEIKDVYLDWADEEWTVVHRADDGTIIGMDGDLLSRGEYETRSWDWQGPFRTKAEAVTEAARSVARGRS